MAKIPTTGLARQQQSSVWDFPPPGAPPPGAPTRPGAMPASPLASKEYFVPVSPAASPSRSGGDGQGSGPTPLAAAATALRRACSHGDARGVRQLLSMAPTVEGAAMTRVQLANTAYNKKGARVLHAACWCGAVDVVHLLLEAGAELDHATEEGASALFVAAQKGHTEVVRALIERGARFDVATQGGYTPLHIAAEHGATALVQLLIDSGAQLDRAQAEGATPLFVAVRFAARKQARSPVVSSAPLQP